MISTFVQLTFNTFNSLLTLSLSESKPNTCLDEHSHQSGGKKRKSPNVSCLDVDDDDVTVDMTGLSESDRDVLDGFFDKLKLLKTVAPPIADKEFKASLSDQSSSVTQLLAEVRVKKKSAGRRQCGESAVPPLVGELQNLEKELKEIHNVFRCYLVLFKFHFV